MVLSEPVTELLRRWESGDNNALDELAPLLYKDLKRLAAAILNQERPGHTLQATALVHEAYLQVRKLDRMTWQSRAHFISMATSIMRRILIDHARQRLAAKRGGDNAERAAIDLDRLPAGADPNMVRLDDALDELAQSHPRQARVVELKFFGGLTAIEIAEVLGGEITTRTVERDCQFARAWLQRSMSRP